MWGVAMGRFHGPQDRRKRTHEVPLYKQPPSAKAVSIYKQMRELERENYGPSLDADSEWWQLNQELARCFGLYEGMVVYEDPEWDSERPMKTSIDMFYKLERASREKPKRQYRYKWER